MREDLQVAVEAMKNAHPYISDDEVRRHFGEIIVLLDKLYPRAADIKEQIGG